MARSESASACRLSRVASIVLALVVLQPLTACDHGTKLRFECPSPNKRFIASFYTMSGGGAAGWMYQYINVRPAGRALRDAQWRAKLKNARDLRLTWLDASRLRVEYPDSARLDDKRTSYGEDKAIAIDYVAQPKGAGGFADGTGGCGQPPAH
jgi:hypothetical protein